MQLPGERSILQRTYAEDIFDNLRNEHGIVGFYIVLAWDASLQSRSASQLLLHDLEQNMGKLQLRFLFFIAASRPCMRDVMPRRYSRHREQIVHFKFRARIGQFPVGRLPPRTGACAAHAALR